MKNILIVSMLSILISAGCRKRTEAPSVSSVLIEKEWRVSFARDFSAVYTLLLSGYKFTFTSDGKMKVNDGITTYNGTWSENQNDRTITFDISSTQFQLDFISQEWKVNNATLTGVNLKDDLATTNQELRFVVF
ncbi:MAG: hypothetical protein ACK5DG_02950 [Chitinophagaceae bacterium]|jgi:hypothetical protein